MTMKDWLSPKEQKQVTEDNFQAYYLIAKERHERYEVLKAIKIISIIVTAWVIVTVVWEFIK